MQTLSESTAWLTSAPSWWRVFAALLVVAAAIALARLVEAALKAVRKGHLDAAPKIYIVEKLSEYVIILAGVFAALVTLGVDLTSLTVFAGAVGVGLGLGLQGIVKEFFSGLVLIFDPLVQVGDFIELDDGVRGEVVEVTARATRLRTNDGVNVVLPNSKMIESRIVNWTHNGAPRRFRIPFEVAEDVDKERVRDAVLAAARALEFTAPDSEGRKTHVWLTGFGEDSLCFELVVWPTLDAIRRPTSLQAAYAWAIDDALRGAGIARAHRQIDLGLSSLFGHEGEDALKTLGLPPPQRAAARAASTSSRNEAAAAVSEEVRVAARQREAERKAKT